MLVDSNADVAMFAKLSAKQIGQLADAFDVHLAEKAPGVEKIRGIVGEDFTESDIRRIVYWFYILFLSKIDYADLQRLTSSLPLEQDKMSVVCATVDKIHGRSDEKKSKTAIADTESGVSGRPHEPESSPDYDPGDPESQIRYLRSLFGLNSREGPPPTIKGMLADHAGDIRSHA